MSRNFRQDEIYKEGYQKKDRHYEQCSVRTHRGWRGESDKFQIIEEVDLKALFNVTKYIPKNTHKEFSIIVVQLLGAKIFLYLASNWLIKSQVSWAYLSSNFVWNGIIHDSNNSSSNSSEVIRFICYNKKKTLGTEIVRKSIIFLEPHKHHQCQ